MIVTDGRNHLELTDERYDIIVTDPPPPIESSGAAVISSKEYYEAGRDHLTENGIMMQWVPFSGTSAGLDDQFRTFASVFPQVTLVRGPGGWGMYMLGSSAPIAFDEANIRVDPRSPRRPRGRLVRLRLAGQDDGRLGPGDRTADDAERR